ncbi:hypothetical protein JANAI62_37950 [Jannaschia pagri]|uniref:CopC domain-containing protein n=1 Tax=Jannaschia pagri TaxID=2829797 RepID=A0ABQ4NS09_9RHOB|nr:MULTISPECIES: copper resistance CopC family protein [unclassified Jannaschia]GIT93370.1 hypothetical protein JANAI61_38280 [Jannaschia sp. AI_61]GIT97172.1 hypothetical protein JANAI62_37950 [Jannaschia sp. AI_62]
MIRQTLLGLAAAIAPVIAFAHTDSEGTTPADGTTVSDVSEISMRFDDPMRIISVTLTSPDGDVEIERETGMEPAREFRATPLEELAPGSYRFDWRGMASDGHPMQGSFSFTVSE